MVRGGGAINDECLGCQQLFKTVCTETQQQLA